MNLTITVLRWIFAIPTALVGSDFFGMLIGFITCAIRHLGSRIFGDVIEELLRKPSAIFSFFTVGVLFVLIGVSIVPLHNHVVIIGFAVVKAWVDYQRRPTDLMGSLPSAAATSGAISTAIVLSYLR
jgi:xanthosine utilization system XapX-like protein